MLALASGALLIIIGAILIGFGIWHLVHRSWLWGILLTLIGVFLGGLHILDAL